MLGIIRVYGIVATLALLLIIVTAGNPAFLSIHNIFNMLSAIRRPPASWRSA